MKTQVILAALCVVLFSVPAMAQGTKPGDYNGDGVLDAADIDLQAVEMNKPVAERDLGKFNHNGDHVINFRDRQIWVHELKNTWFGDANLDGQFNSNDLIDVFVAGKYDSGKPATWSEGDWTGDLQFNSTDLVKALQDGGYEQGERPATPAVPEPSTAVLGLLGLFGLFVLRQFSG